MDIEVGEYVRTSGGKIGKLIRVEFDRIDESLKWYVFLSKDEFGIEKEIYINKPYIVKHSKNIIDLIEDGDYLNGYYCRYITDVNTGEKHLCNFDINVMEWTPLANIDIWESVVTKEQFSQAEYKIEKGE